MVFESERDQIPDRLRPRDLEKRSLLLELGRAAIDLVERVRGDSHGDGGERSELSRSRHVHFTTLGAKAPAATGVDIFRRFTHTITCKCTQQRMSATARHSTEVPPMSQTLESSSPGHRAGLRVPSRPRRRIDRSIDWSYRSEMDPGGALDLVDIPIHRFPAWGSGLVLDRPREWVLIGFAAEGRVQRVALNEGEPTWVAPFLSPDSIAAFAREGGFDSVLVLHNHPGREDSGGDEIDRGEASGSDHAYMSRLAMLLDPSCIRTLGLIAIGGASYEFFWRAPRANGCRQLTFEAIPGFDAGRISPTRWPRGEDGCFVERISPWAKRGLWPTSPPPPRPPGLSRRFRRFIGEIEKATGKSISDWLAD